MDNECSKAVEKHIHSNRMDIQLNLPHNHRVNAPEWAITTFKEHFVAALATVDMLCPLQLWDEFLPQVKLTLNLLHFSCRDPNVSANQEVYGAFDFNKMPLAPLGTKALVYDHPTTRASWAPHATDGFYVGLAIDHHRCLHFYIPATQQCCFSDTWRLYPTHCQLPVTLDQDKTILNATNLITQLGQTVPTTTSNKLKHLNAICQLTAIMAGPPNSPATITPPPRVGVRAPPRVGAPPLRVATSSNNITAPAVTRQLPRVHQRQTRNNNLFHILTDYNDDGDKNMFIASTCSPCSPKLTTTSTTVPEPQLRHP